MSDGNSIKFAKGFFISVIGYEDEDSQYFI